MLNRRRRWTFALSSGALAVVTLVVASTAGASNSPSDSADWALTNIQIAQARQALMLVATQSDPSAPTSTPRATGAWPSNISSGSAFGTDRGTANTAMGEPGAAPASDDSRPVVCAQAQGQFSTAGQTHPPGAVAQIFSYAVICFDASSGDILDTGFDNHAVTGNFTNRVALNVTDPITSTVS